MKKGTVEFREQTFQYKLKKEEEKPQLHVHSKDKKTQLIFVFDCGLPISKGYIVRLLEAYYQDKEAC